METGPEGRRTTTVSPEMLLETALKWCPSSCLRQRLEIAGQLQIGAAVFVVVVFDEGERTFSTLTENSFFHDRASSSERERVLRRPEWKVASATKRRAAKGGTNGPCMRISNVTSWRAVTKMLTVNACLPVLLWICWRQL